MPKIDRYDIAAHPKCTYCRYEFHVGDYYIIGLEHNNNDEPGAIYCSNKCFNGYMDEFRRLKKRTSSWRKKQVRKANRQTGGKGKENGLHGC